jgi:hypothetical protein
MGILSEVNFRIKFIDSVDNSQADAISRPNITIEEISLTLGVEIAKGIHASEEYIHPGVAVTK